MPVVFHLEFNEAVEGLDTTDIQFVESISGLSYSVEGSARDYTLILGGADGPTSVTPSVLVNAAHDLTGNGNAQTDN